MIGPRGPVPGCIDKNKGMVPSPKQTKERDDTRS